MLPFIKRAQLRRRRKSSSLAFIDKTGRKYHTRPGRKGTPFTVFGQTFESRDLAIRYYGLNKATVISRIKEGLPLEDAFNKNSSRAVSYKGKVYQSLRKLADNTGVPLFTLKNRLRLGMTLETALSQSFPSAKKSITVKGIRFESFSAACLYYKISHLVVRARLRFGWSLDQSFGITSRGIKTCKGKVYIIRNTLNEKCYIGITTGPIDARFYKHKSDAKTKPSCKFHIAINEIGPENFYIRQLAVASTYKELSELEIAFIKRFNSISDGYNTMLGGGRTSSKVKD